MLQRIRNILRVPWRRCYNVSGTSWRVTRRRCYNVSGTSCKLIDEDVTTYQERLASYLTKMLRRIRNILKRYLTEMLQRIRNVLQATWRRCYNVSGTSCKLLDEDVTTYQERFDRYLKKMLQRIRNILKVTWRRGYNVAGNRYWQRRTQDAITPPQKRAKVTTVPPLRGRRHQKHLVLTTIARSTWRLDFSMVLTTIARSTWWLDFSMAPWSGFGLGRVLVRNQSVETSWLPRLSATCLFVLVLDSQMFAGRSTSNFLAIIVQTLQVEPADYYVGKNSLATICFWTERKVRTKFNNQQPSTCNLCSSLCLDRRHSQMAQINIGCSSRIQSHLGSLLEFVMWTPKDSNSPPWKPGSMYIPPAHLCSLHWKHLSKHADWQQEGKVRQQTCRWATA